MRGMTVPCSYFFRKISGKTSETKRALSVHTCFPVTSICDVEIPEGLSIYRAPQDESEGRLWLLFGGILCDSGEENASGVTYSETHGPSMTLAIYWKGVKFITT